MDQIIFNWYSSMIQLSEETDSELYELLVKYFPVSNRSKDEIEQLVYKVLDNHPYNHYGKLQDHLTIAHRIIY